MQLLGIALGGWVAILWGTADSMATLSTRRLTTFTTTFISQLSGLLVLTITLLLFLWFRPDVTFTIASNALYIGAATGVLTAVGYLFLYRALALGPVAITSPISSTSAVVTLLLSMFILNEQIAFLDGIALAAVIIGVLLASIDGRGIGMLLKQKPLALLSGRGIPWAFMTAITFGLVDIGIGGASPVQGWFVPAFFTFIFSTLVLAVLLLVRHILRNSRKTLSLHPVSDSRYPVGVLFAAVAGILECLAILTFGMATQIIKPGVTATIASNYSLIAILFGVFILRERLIANQKLGIGIVMCGLTAFAILHL
ncbi:MAG: EamA family transporter [Ktedonobacteraceae bacterium]|nr:EamA family transporter [Ktedonobacteraceae bacterium]